MNAPRTHQIHIRFEGKSFDIPLGDLDIGKQSNDRQVKQTLGEYLNVDSQKFRDYVLDRHANGNMTLRPQAVFG